MSSAVSSKRRGALHRVDGVCAWRPLLATGCSDTTAPPRAGGTPVRGAEAIGYVRMDDLREEAIRCIGELSRLDDDMAGAATASSVGGSGAAPSLPPDLERKEQARDSRRSSTAATDRAKAALKAKQDEYGKREAEAIRDALAVRPARRSVGRPAQPPSATR
jgi:hypothetical protein